MNKPRLVRFQAGHYYKASIFSFRPVFKLIEAKVDSCQRTRMLYSLTWDAKVKHEHLSWFKEEDLYNYYSVSGPIEEVSILEGLMKVGE